MSKLPEKRKRVDITVAPKKVAEFRASLQDAYDSCDAKFYVDQNANTTTQSSDYQTVTSKHLALLDSEANKGKTNLPVYLHSLDRWQKNRQGDMSKSLLLSHAQSTNNLTTRSNISQAVWLNFEAEENEQDAAFQLIRLRKRLGLSTSLPIHGPGGQKALQEYLKNAENEKSKIENDDANGIFYYCLLAGRHQYYAPYNPYDLEVLPDGEEALNSACYWTISPYNVTYIHKHDPSLSEMTPALVWLWERYRYNYLITKYSCFANFRKWRTFRCWCNNVHEQKRDKILGILYRKLFLANEIFQGVLIHVKAMCETHYYGQPNQTEPLCLLDRYAYQETLTLEKFSERQFAMMEITVAKLKTFIEYVAGLAYTACERAANFENITLEALENPSKYFEEEEEITSFLDSKQNRASTLRDLNLKAKSKQKIGPSFTSRKQWSNTLYRLCQFLRSLDYLILELLRRLVKSAAKDLLIHLRESYSVQLDGAQTNENIVVKSASTISTIAKRTESRLSNVTSKTYNSENLSVKEASLYEPISSEPIDIRSLSDTHGRIGTDRNLNDLYPAIEPNDVLDLKRVMEASTIPPPMFLINLLLRITKVEKKADDDLIKSQHFSENEYKVTYDLSPSEYEFKNAIRDILDGMVLAVGRIPSLLDHPNLKIFYTYPNYDKNNEEIERTRIYVTQIQWPDVEYLFGEDEDHQDVILDILNTVNRALTNIHNYVKRYQKYCDMVLSCMQLDIEESLKTKEFTTDDYLFLMTKHTQQLSKMEEMVTEQRICLIELHAEKFYNDVIPYPKHIIECIGQHLPPMAIEKNEKMQKTIREALKLLDRDPKSVEEFVQHLALLNKFNNDLTNLENEFQIITKLFHIIKDFNMNIKAESYAFYRSLASIYQQLKSSLLYTEAQCDENVQKFTVDLDDMIKRLHDQTVDLKLKAKDQALLSAETRSETALDIILILQESLTKLYEKSKNYSAYQERFNQISKQSTKRRILPDYKTLNKYRRADVVISLQTVQNELSDIEHDINLRKLLWESQQNWTKLYKEWTNTPLEAINVDVLQREMNKFTQNIYMLEKGLPQNDIIPTLKYSIIEFKKSLPVIIAFRNPHLKQRHFDQLRVLVGKDIVDDEGLKLKKLLTPEILQHTDPITDISSLASNEAALETMLNKVIERWRHLDFRVVTHHGKETFIITGFEEILQHLEESQVTMTTIKSSRYINPIKQQVDEWDKRLTLLAKTVDEWIACQRRWLYLEQIFSTPDIQLVQETKIFSQIEKSWKELMRKTEQQPNALKAGTTPGTLELLQTNNIQMEKIQRALEDYLETKRLAFPRLYFLSNEDLLDILSHSKDASCVQPHLRKCFANIYYLEIVKQPMEIVTYMQSVEGEIVNFPKTVRPRGVVEQWLNSVETAMYDAVKHHMKLGLADIKQSDYIEWIQKHPGQVVLTISQVLYSREVNSTFNATNSSPHSSLLDALNKMITTINNVCLLVFMHLEQTKLLTVEALLTLQVHWRDIFESLIKHNVKNKHDFEWQRQLRYDWSDKDTNFQILQSNGVFQYGYEYLGCSSRLVVTPLTDRCYLTLTGALKLNVGGAPAGPAGTGKTETVKDLSKSFGKLCLVFNCSDVLDHKTLGKFFSGLAQSGSWCCFDEFNRIDVEVLSVVAQQLLTIKTAKDMQATRFSFDGREIKMNSSCGFFVTMNPTYTGRVELPDNLKPLFRPIAMMVPHFALIGEVILFSVGFTTAKILASKIVYLYNLSSSQLSQQDHYDFGMRAIKSVLLMAGQIKRLYVNEGKMSDEYEEAIMLEALLDSNLPKLLKDDAILFRGILKDLFPNADRILSKHENIENAIRKAISELNYEYWPSQAEKAYQLYNQIVLRHGTMLVGSSGGGKTAVRNILQKALTLLIPTEKVGDNAKLQSRVTRPPQVIATVLNPKSMDLNELYGKINTDTFEFTDGMLSNVMRMYAKNNETQMNTDKHEHRDVWQWLILDGPIDTLWVENLNTVLDDSKILCLSNGERIGLTGQTRILFEVASLENASPATVSRCAMVYLDPSDLGHLPFLHSWYRNKISPTLPEAGVKYLHELMDFSLEKGFSFIDQMNNPWHLPVSRLNILQTLCYLLSTFLNFIEKYGGFGEEDSSSTIESRNKSLVDDLFVYTPNDKKQSYLQKNPKNLKQMLIRIYVFCFTWSFGGGLKREDNFEDDNLINQKDQVKTSRDPITQDFDMFIRDLFNSNVNYGVYLPPETRTVFDYMIDLDTCVYREWESLVPKTDLLIKQDQTDAVIPTIDIVRYSFLITALLLNKKPVLLTGNSGVGKTILMECLIKSITSQDGNLIKPGTILGDVLQYHNRNQTTKISGMRAMEYNQNQTSDTTSESALQSIKIQMSAQTTGQKLVTQVTNNLVKKNQNVLGCAPGRWMIIFIDDLNIPQVDSFDDQPTLEALRYILQTGSAYDGKKNQIRPLSDITFLAACDSPTSGRSIPSKRLLQSFSIFALPDPAAKQLFHIYTVRLGRFFTNKDFSVDVKSSLYILVSCCLVIYYRVCNNILPTPSKVHYIFNLRDLAKLAQGLMQASPSHITTQDRLALLFGHECLRVFCDRLVTNNDIELFYKHLSLTVSQYFKITFDTTSWNEHPLLFCNFLKTDEKLYQQLNDWKQCCPLLLDYQLRCNLSGQSSLKMVFFKEAVEHVLRICRVLQQPGGHVLLIGLDGTGRRTCLELASFISGHMIYMLSLKRGYGDEEFRDDLKNVFKLAAIQNRPVSLFIQEKDVISDTFIEDIESILNSGTVVDLFETDEFESMVMELKNDAYAQDNQNQLTDFFYDRIRTNLHVILSFSPAGSTFREYCRLHPALLNCTTIDWFKDWTELSMLQVADVFLENADLSILDVDANEDLRNRLAQCCVQIHQNVTNLAKHFYESYKRHYYLTPSSYMDLMKTYVDMMQKTKAEFLSNYNRLSTGLSKLSEANDSVGIMREELLLLSPQIDAKEKEIELLLIQLQKDQIAVLEVKEIVENEEEKVRKDTQMVEKYAEQAEHDLENVIPILQDAMADVSLLEKADVAEVRVYQSPPYQVMMVMCAVCVLLEAKADWASARQVLGDPGFIHKMTNLDINNISDKTYRKLLQYSKNPQFTPEIIGKVSSACKSFCKWVLAIQRYYEVYRTVKPKEEKVRTANEALDVMRKSLARKQEMLKLVRDHLNELEMKYQNSVDEKRALYERRELMNERVARAAELTNVLAVEKVRWQEQLTQLHHRIKSLIGNALLSASAINYFGPFNSEYRLKLMTEFQSILTKYNVQYSMKFNIIEFLTTKSEIRNWISENLPDDECSIENATLVKHSTKWTLLIDPQRQAIRWIRTKEAPFKVRVILADDPNLLRTCEQCIRLGVPLIIDQIGETIEPSLLPLLNKDIVSRSGGVPSIRLNDVEIEYNPNFRVYFITQLSNPHYLPDICIRATLVNFTITHSGLEHQLLSLVVLNEEPELERERKLLLESMAQDLNTLRKYEDLTLELLTTSEQHLLDRNDLIETLKKSKLMSEEVNSRINENENNERNINIAREYYMMIAVRGALLYFLIENLSNLNIMYQFSLTWFQRTFHSCIIDHDPTKRVSLTNITDFDLMQHLKTRRSGSIGLVSSLTSPRHSISENIGVSRQSTNIDDLPMNNVRTRRNTKPFVSSISPHQRTLQLQNIVDKLTYSVYKLVSWSLFAEHQLLFSFLLTTTIARELKTKNSSTIAETSETSETITVVKDFDNEKRMIHKNEWTCFMGPLVANMSLAKLNIVAEKLPNIYNLCEILLKEQFMEEQNPYTYLIQKRDSEVVNDNSPYYHLTNFQCLLLVKLLRPDLLLPSISQYVSMQLGSKFLSSNFAKIEDVYAHSTPQAPIILLLSSGTDPTNLLIRFAKETRGSASHLDVVSLGQGQGPKAEELLSKALALKGRWIFIQNCHLGGSFMPRLKALVNNFNKPGLELDSQFRLFLSSKPDPNFPLEVLQLGLKMTIEWPRGLKSSLLQTFGASGIVNEKLYEDNSLGPYWRRLVFNLAFFHAVIHERKKFGPLGWNLSYEFNNSDLEVAVLELENLVRYSKNVIPFNVFCYLAGSVIYGGRVTDEFDRRRLLTIIEKFYSEDTLKENYTYSDNAMYKAPSLNLNFTDLLSYIKSLPDYDDPAVFQMNPNTNRALMIVEATKVVDMLATIEPQYRMISFGSYSDADTACKTIIKDLIGKLPNEVRIGSGGRHLSLTQALKKTEEKLNTRYHEYSVFFGLFKQELHSYNDLLQLIHNTCQDLDRALNGEIVVNETLENIQKMLVMHKVPLAWQRKSYPSTKALPGWINDLLERLNFFTSWSQKIIAYAEDQVTSSLPQSFWIGAFYYPKGLFSAILQSSARSMSLSIDQLKYSYEVLDNLNDDSTISQSLNIADGIVVDGIYLDGAQWDTNTHQIIDCTDQTRIHRLPPLLCKLISKSNDFTATEQLSTMYECPIYRTLLRAVSANEAAKHLVHTITIPCSENESFWITRSIAATIEIDE